MPQRHELRLVLRDGERHAILLDARVEGGDIYAGPRLVWGDKLFRQRPHARPKEPAAKLQLSKAGGDLDALDWSHRPRRDNRKRVSATVDLSRVAPYPGFTTELWAFEPERRDLIDEHLSCHYEPAGRVVAHVLADWTRPNLLGLLWTLKTPAWEGLLGSEAPA